MEAWATFGAILLLSLNLCASFAAVRSVSFTRAQKWIHLLLVWLMPVVGAILILGFLVSDPSQPLRSSDEESQAAGDITVLDQGPTPCGGSGSEADSD